jgi:hypothetical protein
MRLIATLAGLALLAACSGESPDETAPAPDAGTAGEAAPAAETAGTGDTAPQGTDDTDSAEEDAAAAGVPAVDIYMTRLSWVGDIPAIGAVTNATDRPGYDNQPAFTRDGTGFYFTSGDSANTDIWRCNLDCTARTRITDTPDAGEYSPRPTPAGGIISYIYQPPGGYGGQVWYDDPEGGNARAASDVGPNGYYAFNADMTRLAVFALEDPVALKVFGRFEDTGIVTVADNIGRALYAAPDHESVYFTLPREDGGFALHETDFHGETTAHVFDMPGAAQDYAVFALADGRDAFFTVDEGVLMMRTRERPWHSVADLKVHGLEGITRLAVSPDRTHLAIVASEPAGD